MPTRQRFKRPRRTSKGKRSKFEDKVQDLLGKKGIGNAYEQDSLPYTIHQFYKPDWTLASGVFLEAKGRFDYIERRKILAVRESNPDADIRLVFMRDQKISKSSSTTYVEWCAKHEIMCSVFPELPL